MVINIQFLSYLSGGAAFLFLAVLVGLSRTGGLYKYLLLAGCVATVLWALSIACFQWISGFEFFTPWTSVVSALDVVRNVAWLALLAALLGIRSLRDAGSTGRLAALAVSVVSLALIFAEPLSKLVWPDLDYEFQTLHSGGRVVLAVVGMLALENLYRNAEPKVRWAIKYFCFGLGTILGFDFFVFADAALFGRVDQAFFDARGFVNALVSPLLAIAVSRATLWEIDIHVSRTAVFHSAALIGSGVYLIGMAAAGFYLKGVGGEWGRILQILFLARALLILIVIFSSGSVRAKVKVSISKHFFSYKYDYREEWLRFIRTVATVDSGISLHDRILRSIADIIQCDAGGLWVLRQEDRAYLPSALWHMGGRRPGVPETSELVGFLNETQWIVDLDEYRRDAARYDGVTFPSWMVENKKIWLIVPLIFRDSVQGFIVLGDPKARRGLDWEDFDLLRTVGHQAASYLVEQQAMNELSDARRLQDFNRRSAFIVHDIKNVVSQMSLMLQNAERFGDNPEFQKDMVATVGNSVARMKELLERFKRAQEEDSRTATDLVPLQSVIRQVVENWRKQKDDMIVEIEDAVTLKVEREKMVSILDHLLQNAIEAAGTEGVVILRQRKQDDEACIEVEDNGPGMDQAYVDAHLFRPLDSEKTTGFGLGAYQTRQLVREIGGRLEVSTEPGRGTTMRVILPVDVERSWALRNQEELGAA